MRWKWSVFCLVAVIVVIFGYTSWKGYQRTSTNGNSNTFVSHEVGGPEPAPKMGVPAPFPQNGNGRQTTQQSEVPAPAFPQNEYGQTYGSAMNSQEPDLILAYGVGGTLGYVRSSDLNGMKPNTPEQALAQQRNNTGKGRMIPLYSKDGKTIIGVFMVEP